MRRKLLLFFCLVMTALSAFSQSTTVTGKITDDKGAGIPGATITTKKLRKVLTLSANDGSFTAAVPSGETLVISAVGYTTFEAEPREGMTISLKTDVGTLSEVVVTGIGVATSKRRLGISVESITSDKLPPIPAATVDQALVGKIPGAQISTISGNPGDKVNIVLRGINTVQGGTRPLVMLDGTEVPFEYLTTLDPSQIERVEIVQGAASATIYGAQGANGVIQLFSKKGVKGRLSISLSSSVSKNSFINTGHFGKAKLHPYLTDANGNIVYQGSNEDLGYTAGQPITVDPVTGIILGTNSLSYQYGSNDTSNGFNPVTIPGLTQNYTRYGILDPRNQNNKAYTGSLQFYDHFAQVFQDATSRNHSLSVNGGNEKVDFNFTVSNNRTNSPLLENSGYLDRTNVTANIGFTVFKNFTIRSNTSLAYTANTLRPFLGAPGGYGFGLGRSNANVNGVYGFLNTSPFFSLKDTVTGGNYPYYQRASFASVNAANPFYRLEYTKGSSKRYDIIQNVEANYNISKFVTLNAKYGITYKNENDIWTFYNQSLNGNVADQESWTYNFNGTDATGEIDNWQYNYTQQNFLGAAIIKTDFKNDFNINFPLQTNTLLRYDFRRRDYKELDTWGQSLPLNPPFNLLATQSQHVASDYIEPFVTYGYVVDQRLDFGDYGGITGGFRTDYSSAFGEGHKPFTFPHINGYLNLPAFAFWQGADHVISNFKLRAAYGKAGIQPQPFDRYSVISLQQTGSTVNYSNLLGARNPLLDVEVSQETEVGTDIGIKLGSGDWLKMVNISATYWKRHTDNAIYPQLVPPSTGATTIISNAIELHSHGWQVAVNIPVVTSKNFTWDFTANLAHQESFIDNVVGGDIPLTTGAGSSGLILAGGRKIGEIYGYKALTSIAQLRADGKTPFIDPANQGDYEIVKGRVVNKITKAIFFSDEAESFGDPNPKLNSSFISSMTWKRTLSFGFQFDWLYGTHLYNQTDEWMYRDGISSDFTKPVTINGQTGAWTAYYASAYYALGNTAKGVGNNVTKDFFYKDASFVRLRNVSVGIDFAGFAKQDWLKKCQLVFSGRNLITITPYSGMDPEISSGSSNSAFDRGIDHSTIPNLKSYQVSLNLNF